MPSYLVSAKEAFVPVELYKPPFEALGDMLRIKQQQYMQGFQRIKSLDNSLLNKPVLGEEANARKQEYMADISRKLKDLPNVDLSLPQNQAEAEKVFEPIINDKALNYNRELTADAYNQINTAESYELSDDPKKRAQYHYSAKQDIYDMMEEIGEAGLDPKNYQKIARRKFTPFFDIKQDIIDRFKSEKGMDLSYDEIQGNYIVRTTNGTRSLHNYELMGLDVLNDPKYNAQLSVQSRVEINNEIRKKRQLMPEMSRDQARQQVITEMSESAKTYYNNLHDDLNTQSSALRENLIAMGPIEQDPNKPGFDPRRIEIAKSYGSQISSIEKQINNIAGNKAKLIQGVAISPENYIAERIRNGYIESFAKSRAANTSTEIKTNEVPFKISDDKYKWSQHALAIRKQDWDEKNPSASSGSSSSESNPDGTPKLTAHQQKLADNAPSIVAYELNTDKTNTNEFAVWNNYMNKIKDKAKTALFDTNSGMVVALSTLGDTITPIDIMHFTSAMQKDSDDPNYKFNKEEAAASKKITKIVKEKHGIDITGPGSLANALLKIAKNYGDRVSTGEIQDNGNLLIKLEASTDEYIRNNKEYDGYNQEFIDLVTKNIQDNPKYNKILSEEGGKKTILTPEKLAEEFTNLKYIDSETNTLKKVDKNKALSMAEAYLIEGKDPITIVSDGGFLKTNRYPVMNINGQQVKIEFNPKESKITTTTDPSTGHEYNDQAALNGFMYNLNNRYGKAAELSTLYKSALSQVVPSMKHWKEKTGEMTPVMSIPFSTQLTGEKAVRLVKELAYGNNIARATIADADGGVRDLTPEERLAFMNIMKADEGEVEKAFGDPSYRPFTTGKGTVQLTLSPSLDKNYIALNKIDKLIGKAVNFQLSPDAKGETIKNISVDEQFYTYGDVYKGKPVESNSVLKDLGYYFRVVPNFNDERANSVTVYYNYKIPNSQNPSNPIPQQEQSQVIPIKGDGAVNIDQVVAQARMNLVKQFKAVQQSIPKVSSGSSTAIDPTSFIR
jgi:hypothetical protein